jgi:hypothetical protein
MEVILVMRNKTTRFGGELQDLLLDVSWLNSGGKESFVVETISGGKIV